MNNNYTSPDFSYFTRGNNSSQESNHPNTAPESRLTCPVNFDATPEEKKTAKAISEKNMTYIMSYPERVAQYAQNNFNLQQYLPQEQPELTIPVYHNPNEYFAQAMIANDIDFIANHMSDCISWLYDNNIVLDQGQQKPTEKPVEASSVTGSMPNSVDGKMCKETAILAKKADEETQKRSEMAHQLMANSRSLAVTSDQCKGAKMLPSGIVSEPYDLMYKYLSNVRLISVNGTLRKYNGWYYEELGDDELEKSLMDVCRQDISQDGGWKLVREAKSFIKAEPSIVIKDEDIPDCYLSLRNGILDLNTGTLLLHTPDIITTYGVDANYLVGQSSSTVPERFNNFLAVASDGNPNHIRLVLRFFGYSLTADASAKKIFDLQGKSGTGKTVLISLLQCLLTADSHTAIDVKELSTHFALEKLPGKVLLVCPDMTADPLTPKITSKLKQLSGRDLISSDRKYKTRVVFRCKAKIALVTNHPIITKTPDTAFFNRLITIPFGNPIPEDTRDPNFVDNLYKYERDGIVTEALNEYLQMRCEAKVCEQLGEGCDYDFGGYFSVNTVVEDDGTQYINVDDSVRDFIQNCIEINPDERVNTRDAYEAFSRLYGYMGEDSFNKLFNKYIPIYYGDYAIQSRGQKAGASNGPRGFKGIALKSMSPVTFV